MIAEAMASYGRIDILCNNAGIENYRATEDYAFEEWKAIADTNLLGPFLCSKYALPHLRKVKGSVINIASAAAHFGSSLGGSGMPIAERDE